MQPQQKQEQADETKHKLAVRQAGRAGQLPSHLPDAAKKIHSICAQPNAYLQLQQILVHRAFVSVAVALSLSLYMCLCLGVCVAFTALS